MRPAAFWLLSALAVAGLASAAARRGRYDLGTEGNQLDSHTAQQHVRYDIGRHLLQR